MTQAQQSFAFTPPGESLPARRNLVIEAGAGTGKTTTLVAEVLRLMLERERLSPERIVLVTFTEKAAGEIADRIREALEALAGALAADASGGRIVWPLDSAAPLLEIENHDRERARHAFERHLEQVDSIRSQTIHSFCQSLLRAWPVEAGLDPQFKIVEGFERSLLHSRIYEEWLDLETRVARDPLQIREWEILFTHAGYLFQIRELILSLFERRDLLGEESYDYGSLDEAEAAVVDAVHAVRRAGEPGEGGSERIVRYLTGNEPPQTAGLDESSRLDAWIDYLQPIASAVRETNLPKRGILKEALRLLRASEKKGSSIWDRLASHRAATALVSMTRRFVRHLDEEKRRLGVVDFDDLLLRTQALLDDPAVLERARKQFDFIFIDEFQDTDRTQARILDRLARDPSGAYVPGRTIVVGDPKQSIYGFRRADPETYYRMTSELVAAGAERRVIRDQYRSDPTLLEAFNRMFPYVFSEGDQGGAHDPNVFHPSYPPLRAGRPADRRPHDAPLVMLQTDAPERHERNFAEGEVIAQWIAAHRDGDDGDLQRFAILFRRLTKLDDYLDALDRHGISYVLPPTRMFLDRRAPVDLLAVLRAIAYPADRGAQVSAARSPYFALTDVEILAGVTGSGDPSGWIAFSGALTALAAEARHLTVSDLIDRVIATSGIEAVYAATTEAPRHLRHLEHVRKIAFEYDQRAGGSVRQFVDEIAKRRREPEEVEPSLLDDSQNAVRIMSVHAAKGLEFDTVLLPDLAFQSTSGDAVQLFTVEEPRSLVLTGRAESLSAHFRHAGDEPLRRIASRRDEAEMRRLFYVAVTRAMSQVVFVCSLSPETRVNGFLRCLTEAFGTDREELMSLWPSAGREVRETRIGNVAFERMAVVTPPREIPDRAAVRPRLHDFELEHELSFAPPVPLEITAGDSKIELLTPADVATRRAGSGERVAGLLLHRVLELWDGESDPTAILGSAATESGADGRAVRRVRQRLEAIQRSPTLLRLRSARTLGREVPVRYREGEQLVEKRIDRLIRTDAGELVVDYKSGKPDPERLERDRDQVQRYCEAITAITGRRCDGLLWYIDLESDLAVEVPALACV